MPAATALGNPPFSPDFGLPCAPPPQPPTLNAALDAAIAACESATAAIDAALNAAALDADAALYARAAQDALHNGADAANELAAQIA